jgi:diguanylate cyclase (GGDEF)-like protein
MLKSLVISILLITSIICNLSIAASNEKSESKILTDVREYTLRDDIVAIVELSTKTPNKAHNFEQRLAIDASTLNYAEQYLVLLVKATIKQHEQHHNEVISLIEEAKLLREYIAETQLDLPLFSNAYLVLANSYVAIKDYDNAYQNKKAFVDDYNDYNDAKRENTVGKLTKKYEVANKNEANRLLTNQNKLKELRIDDVKKQQQSQQKKFILIVCTILLFVLLFLRQLKVRKKLLVLAQTDSLTGLLNRAALFSKGQKLMQTSIEQQLELSLILFDIDHFKLINDEFGHSVGDLILAKIAELVNETMRSRDVFSRLGGEEFVAILPSTDHDQAKAIAVRVMEKISQYNFSTLGVNSNITLSIGVANIKDTNAEFDDILHAADLAMYQAKSQGRNQMVSYKSIAKDQERRQL